jgi:hypothetical protein
MTKSLILDEADDDLSLSSAVLYGLIHARFIITIAGLSAMVRATSVSLFFIRFCC